MPIPYTLETFVISIHALREEGDHPAVHPVARPSPISIHALREEGDFALKGRFQLFPISIHALREEGDFGACRKSRNSSISIHALREEGDQVRAAVSASTMQFLSTPSARRATHRCWMPTDSQCRFLSTPSARRATDGKPLGFWVKDISIHALREEGDSKNREKTPCFCLIIHLPAQIAKRCL